MVVACEEIKGSGESFPGFEERRRALSETLLDISGAWGDASHVSGPAGYIVRFTTSKWLFQRVPARDAFLVVDNVDNLLIFERRSGEEPQLILTLSAEDDWWEETCSAFAEFRERLDGRD